MIKGSEEMTVVEKVDQENYSLFLSTKKGKYSTELKECKLKIKKKKLISTLFPGRIP